MQVFPPHDTGSGAGLYAAASLHDDPQPSTLYTKPSLRRAGRPGAAGAAAAVLQHPAGGPAVGVAAGRRGAAGRLCAPGAGLCGGRWPAGRHRKCTPVLFWFAPCLSSKRDSASNAHSAGHRTQQGTVLLPPRWLRQTRCHAFVQYAEGSTVVDMTSNPPKVLRRGLGDAAAFDAMADDLVPA